MSARCERARQWASLELDGALSPFEAAMLARHLRSCRGCKGFAAAVAIQTKILRDAPLDEPARPIDPLPAPVRGRRPARIAVGAVAMAASAVAALVLGAPGNRTSHAARRVESGPMFVVITANPRAGNKDFTVPRLQPRSAAADDGPVHGYLSTPA